MEKAICAIKTCKNKKHKHSWLLKKVFNVQRNVGKVRYLVNFHNGRKTHKDGSAFFDIKIFSNRNDLDAFTRKLCSQGYVRS